MFKSIIRKSDLWEDSKEYYYINNQVCVLCDDIKISDIEKFFKVKIKDNKLFRSLTTLNYFVYTTNGMIINFNNNDLKIGVKMKKIIKYKKNKNN